MNTQQIQFNRQRVAALLLAGSILAAIVGLTGADVSIGPAKWGTGSEKTDGGKRFDRSANPCGAALVPTQSR